jgi:hypothetical protein
MDINGRKLMEEEWINNSSEKQLDISLLPTGVYFLNIKNGEGILHIEKLVKL